MCLQTQFVFFSRADSGIHLLSDDVIYRREKTLGETHGPHLPTTPVSFTKRVDVDIRGPDGPKRCVLIFSRTKKGEVQGKESVTLKL